MEVILEFQTDNSNNMASKVTNSNGALKREKKVAPSSHGRTIQRQGSNKLTAPESTGKDKTISSGKPTLSHVKKPTLVSRAESLKYVKKPAHEDTTQRATLLRRRSFDKPPQVSPVHSSVISPTETLKHVKKTGPEDSTQKASLLRRRSLDKAPPISRVNSSVFSTDRKERVVSRDRTGKARPAPITPKAYSSPKPAASASSNPATPKATSSQKSALHSPTTPKATTPRPVHDRTSKIHKGVKSHSPAAKTIKRDLSLSRNATQSKKNESDTSVPLKIPIVDDTVLTVHVVNEGASGELTLSEQTACAENEVHVVCDEIKTEDEDHDIHEVDVHEVKSSETEEFKLSDHNSTVSEGQSGDPQVAEVETLTEESEMHGEEQGGAEHEAEENQSNEVSKECVVTEEDKVEAEQNKEEENVKENVAYSEEPAEEKKHEDKEQGAELISEELESKHEENVVAISAQPEAAEKQQEATDVAEKRQPVGRGKKETQAYNDVIEETKNKLLESRKNKVRALVGAFETVIDYESGTR